MNPPNQDILTLFPCSRAVHQASEGRRGVRGKGRGEEDNEGKRFVGSILLRFRHSPHRGAERQLEGEEEEEERVDGEETHLAAVSLALIRLVYVASSPAQMRERPGNEVTSMCTVLCVLYTCRRRREVILLTLSHKIQQDTSSMLRSWRELTDATSATRE